MRLNELREELEKRGLDSAGTKSVLLERISKSVEEREDYGDTETEAQSRSPAATGTAISSELSSELSAIIREEVSTAVAEALSSPLFSNQQQVNSGDGNPPRQLVDLTKPHGSELPPWETDNSSSLQWTRAPAEHSAVPPVPKQLQDKILRGAFIDLNLLLPDGTYFAGAESPASFELSASDSNLLRLVPQGNTRPVKRRVHDLGTWIEAWTSYMQVICAYAPDRMSELLGYQAIIATANKQYLPDAWLSYDQQFRLSVSNQVGKRRATWCTHSRAAVPFGPPAKGLFPKPPPVTTPLGRPPAKSSAGTSMREDAPTPTAASATPATNVATTMPVSSVQRPLPPTRDPVCSTFRSPLHVSRFAALLSKHPDLHFVRFVLDGLHHGFAIGFTGNRRTNVMSSNLPSATMHAAFISNWLAESCARQETAGPFAKPPFPFMYCSGVGAVPKKNGSLRMIHHLSSPLGSSVNDGIPSDPFSLQYVRIDDAVNLIMSSPAPVFLSKLDVKSAFRQIPVRSADFHLLGIFWKGFYYYEQVLPFGLRSSPYIFNSVADAIEWIIRHEFSVAHLLHYLDDFLNIVSGRTVALQQLAILLRAFNYLGVPLAPAKIEGPSQTLTFLGIELDTIEQEARLPAEKLTELRALITGYISQARISKRNLDSILGKLSYDRTRPECH